MPIVPAGSTNLNAIGVPNVLVQVQPQNPLLNGVPTNIVGVVGTATWGPTNSPQTVGSLQEYVNLFGPPQTALFDLGTPIYNAIQQGANDFVCIRVTDGTDIAAYANIPDSNVATACVLTSKYTGAYGNTVANISGLSASISPGSTNATYRLTIYLLGGVPEVFDNIGGTGAAFWANLANAVNLGQNNLRGPSQLVTASTGNNIGSISVTSAGSYATLPTLGTTGPGTGAVLNPIMDAVSATITAAGTGYVPADTITLTGGTHSANAVLTVATVKLVSAAINAGGANYNVGDTVGLAGGTFAAAAVATVDTVNGSGAILTFHLSTLGSYTVETSSFTQGSTSGIGSGATFNTAVWGVNSVTVSTPGSYSLLPSNPVAQGSTSGIGTGATFTILWGLASVVVSSAGSGYTSASIFTVTGGGGTGGALGTIVLGGATGNPPSVPTNYTFANGTNGNSGVTDSTLIGLDTSTRTGMYALRNTGASICVLSDQTNPTYWPTQITFGLSEGIYMIGTMSNIYSNNVASAITAKQAAAVSSYAFKLMLGDWVLIADPFNNVNRFTSPQGFVAGILATLDPSGSSLNKQMNGIVDTQKTANKQVYSDADLLLLLQNGIDVLTSPLPLAPNTRIFGCRLGCNTSANITTNGDNYTRMINFLAKTFDQGLGEFIGLPQTVDVQRKARNTLQTFLQNLVTTGSIGTVDGSPAFRVILDATNNPAHRVALGYMQADVQVTLLSIIQRFVINLQAGQSVQIQVLPAQLVS